MNDELNAHKADLRFVGIATERALDSHRDNREKLRLYRHEHPTSTRLELNRTPAAASVIKKDVLDVTER